MFSAIKSSEVKDFFPGVTVVDQLVNLKIFRGFPSLCSVRPSSACLSLSLKYYFGQMCIRVFMLDAVNVPEKGWSVPFYMHCTVCYVN